MVLSMERWQGKVAVVTGASSGIGAAIAKKLVEEGLIVVGVARRSENIDAMAAELADKKGKLYSFKADVTKEEDIKQAFKWTKENVGLVHVLVNNAGIHYRESLLDGNPEHWKRTFDINVLALCIATKEATTVMRENNIAGHVIHINSIGGHTVIPLPNLDVYAGSKFAVTALTETLRQELNAIDSKIRVTSISPGAVDTPIFDEEIRNSDGFKAIIGDKILQAEDIADAIVYVLSTPPHVQVLELTIKPVNEKLLLPVLAFIICWQMSNWTNALALPPPAERNEMDFKACQKNWWATLLLVNNFWQQNEMCNLGTWYLSNDFQMFILAMIFFYLMANYNFGEEIIFYTMSFFWTVHAYLISTNNFGVIFNFTPENAKVENSVASYLLYVLYTAFYGNFGSYGIGLLFGGLFHKYKNHVIKANEFLTYSWLLIFFGFPISAVYLSMFEYPRLISGIVGASLKPIFSLGIAVGMLGMSHGIGGIIKSICEWNFVVFLAKWTYSTYLVHFGVVFGRYLIFTDVVHISDEILTKSVISDLIQSFASGLVLHLLVERPITNTLKKILNRSTTAKIKSG